MAYIYNLTSIRSQCRIEYQKYEFIGDIIWMKNSFLLKLLSI